MVKKLTENGWVFLPFTSKLCPRNGKPKVDLTHCLTSVLITALFQFLSSIPLLGKLQVLFKVTFMTDIKGMQRNSILLDYSSCTASALFSTIIFHMHFATFPYSKRGQHFSCPQKTSRKHSECLFKQHQQRQRSVAAAGKQWWVCQQCCRAGRSPTLLSGQLSKAEHLQLHFKT